MGATTDHFCSPDWFAATKSTDTTRRRPRHFAGGRRHACRQQLRDDLRDCHGHRCGVVAEVDVSPTEAPTGIRAAISGRTPRRSPGLPVDRAHRPGDDDHVRAVDDSGNIETPSAGVAVKVKLPVLAVDPGRHARHTGFRDGTAVTVVRRSPPTVPEASPACGSTSRRRTPARTSVACTTAVGPCWHR